MSRLIDGRRLGGRWAAPLLALSLAACGGGETAQQKANPMSADAGSNANALAVTKAAAAPAYNYAEALQKAILFYEAQQSGKKPDWNRVSWRGDSRLTDGSDVGLDLTGGWYDAGDHVKFGFPAASTATQLAWGALEFEAGHKDAGQHDALLRNLRWINDYFIKAHPSANVFYGQVGNGSTDHSWWGPVEVYPKEAPAYKIDATCGGSDLAGETAAAMAAASMVFKSSDPTYAATLLTHARQLYTLADTKRQKYVECITDAQGYYNSWSGYSDELAWGAIWLYRATGEAAYLTKAESFVTTGAGGFGSEGQTAYLPYKWTQDWDSKHYGSYLLLARLTGKQKYKDAIERNLAYWTTGTPEGERVTYTPGGLAWLSQWGSLRYALNESFIALAYAKDVTDATKQQRYRDFAMQQLNYALGSNPRRSSYLIGFGANSPQHPHHRTAHGSWSDSQSLPTNHRHVLYGAMVGGPNATDGYTDSINDYVSNEVAIDYNAAVVGVLAGAQQLFPGSVPLANFPQAEVPTDDQYFVEAALNSTGNTYTEVKAVVNNRSGWPARVADKLSLRYYLDLSEVIAAGRSAADLKVSSNYNEGGVARGLVRCGASNLYYVTGDFSGTKIYPGGQSAYKKEIQIRIAAPDGTTYWNPANDPSYAGLGAPGTAAVKVSNITLYDDGRKVWGNEPAACGGVALPVPATPTSLAATAGVGSISLSWAASTNATGYSLKRSTSGTAGSFALVASPAGTSYVDSGLAGGTRYYYTVSARNDSGESAASDAVWASTPVGAPASPAPTATAGNAKVTLNWPAVTGAASYEVSRATSATGGYTALASGLTALTYADSGLTNGSTYFYKVGARNTAGVTLSDPVSATPSAGGGGGGGGGGTTNCTLTLDTTSDWGSGQVLRVLLSNAGTTPITNWGLSFTESNTITIANSWSGTFAVTGNKVTFAPASWNSTVQAGASIDAGMQLGYSGAKPTPSAVVMTGASCTVVVK
ncbi:glycoside hydrolase family 9 protein [Roseateles amylovorans]|uniref:Endoglucanase n=1 Tax=Roseateles amylovorans TaxID=2978473 RepID=A0ABY6AZR1_9BURK|nr:glycoside hydrolase family 9 protein [Roseateles amylovorans]UXH77904.1 glycoside hydrolase family 9 protein [Roseateles amylovorans]